jgi:membrane fusion protein (multidrug efflux system)
MVVTADGTVEQRQVEVSRTVGDKWLVSSGLTAGDRVIVEGLQKVQPGMPVEADEAAPAAATLHEDQGAEPETTTAGPTRN